jgi:hypothetical protein
VEIKKRFSNEYYRLASLLLTTFGLKTKEREIEKELKAREREGDLIGKRNGP